MKHLLFLCALLPVAASAATTYTATWSVSTAIPDNSDVGYTDTRILSMAEITQIQNVTLNLNFTGGWNGDLYAYLVHGSGFAVLLNRPGRSVSAPDGSATGGLGITLDDSAASDIHTAIPMSGGSVTGTFQPDGRTTDPLLVLSSDARPALLSSFAGFAEGAAFASDFLASSFAGAPAGAIIAIISAPSLA